MTVCIACLFNWVYSPEPLEVGKAVFLVSDRMLTADDIEYEPDNMKVGFIGKRTVIMVAGAMVTHSEAFAHTRRVLGETPTEDVETIANLYAKKLQEIRLRRAVNAYLSPLGLDENTFVQKQNTMVQSIVYDLTDQLQRYSLNVEAIVAGCDGKNRAHIYVIGDDGLVTCHDDIGFAAIGMGADQAKSQFMYARYGHSLNYYYALPILYAAKRRAESSPGVGKASDYFLITRLGCERVEPRCLDVLERNYDELGKVVQEAYKKVASKLQTALEQAVENAEKMAPNQSISSPSSPSDQT